ncbi:MULTISPECIES: ChrR family anti-sigma-E factor [Rhodobacterales]|uniref:ChrR family anti-sigma-E factor n=1 Tax=Roseobacter sp. N2S TaxID=2663844 RepID=UPI002854EB19|nr:MULTISPECIES: ChrR family anti-sigma-E factor [Rhodobacterales]MDR6266143.1 putative transcriptional regulator [Roseobacter sp. N2S]
MTVKHILNEQLLMGYAAGILPEAFDLVVASHLSLSDESRAMLGGYEAIGGAVMEDSDAVEMGADALASVMGRIKSEGTVQSKPAIKHAKPGILPEPLQDYVGGDVDKIKWRPLGGGVKQAILRTSGKAQARLLFIPAGAAVPDHGHRGTELTLVLQGAFSDEVDTFARGDIEIANEDLNHQPIASEDADCICLAATDAPLRFNSLIPRLLQPIFRI